MQSTVLYTLLKLIGTASGTNRLRDGVHAMARERKRKRKNKRSNGKKDGTIKKKEL